MTIHTPSQYLSRTKAREFFGGYHAIPTPVLETLKHLFEAEGEPRKINFHPRRADSPETYPALLFDRRKKSTHFMLIKVEGDLYGLFPVNDNLEIQPGAQEFLNKTESNWRSIS